VQHAWTKARWRQVNAILDFVRERGVVHPREVDAHFAHGKTTTRWFEQRIDAMPCTTAECCGSRAALERKIGRPSSA